MNNRSIELYIFIYLELCLIIKNFKAIELYKLVLNLLYYNIPRFTMMFLQSSIIYSSYRQFYVCHLQGRQGNYYTSIVMSQLLLRHYRIYVKCQVYDLKFLAKVRKRGAIYEYYTFFSYHFIEGLYIHNLTIYLYKQQ